MKHGKAPTAPLGASAGGSFCSSAAAAWPTASCVASRPVGSASAVDATQNSELSKIYEVNGYPSLKAFYKGKLTDQAGYDGPRDVEGMVGWALQTLEALGVEAEVPQLLDAAQFKRSCVAKKGALCAVAFLPHILDSGAAGREAYLDTLKAVAKKHRQLWTFLWSEVGEQEALEASLGGLAGVPTLAAISGDKGRFALMRDAFDAKHAAAFVGGVLRGSTKTQPASFGAIATVDEWDGKDGELPEEAAPRERRRRRQRRQAVLVERRRLLLFRGWRVERDAPPYALRRAQRRTPSSSRQVSPQASPRASSSGRCHGHRASLEASRPTHQRGRLNLAV